MITSKAHKQRDVRVTARRVLRGVALAVSGALAGAGLGAGEALAAAGGLDPGFGVGGKLALDAGGDDHGNAVALQPDGKIVVVATSGSDVVVYRLNPDGSQDGTFDTDGTARIDAGGTELAHAVALQPDGKIVVAGYTSAGAAGYDAVVWRLKPNGGTTNTTNGALDPTFDTDGAALLNSGGNESGNAVALQPDGKIVVAGDTSAGAAGYDAVVWRLKPDGGTGASNGALDTTFDTDGAAGLHSGGNESGNAVALQPDGKIVVAGYTTAGTTDDAVVWRLKPNGGTGASNGALDTTFDTDGAAGLHSGGDEVARALALQPDGKIVVAGNTSASVNGGDAVVWRLKPGGGTGPSNGALDTTFDTGGSAKIDSGNSEAAFAVALQPDGKIVVAGHTSLGFTASDGVVWRLKPDGGTTGASNGALDTTFDTDGSAIIDSGGAESTAAVALQPDRKIVVAGYTNAGGNAVVQRLFGDPFTLMVGKSGSGSGAVASTPAGIDCGLTCSSGFDGGTQVTLTATPAAGSTFAGWSGGGCSGNGPCTLSVGPGAAVNATFNTTAAGGQTPLLAVAAARRLTLSPTRFRAASSGASVSAKRKRRPPIGTKVTLLLTASAAANLTVERPATGRRSGKSCAKPTRKNRKARKCTRYIKLRGTITRPAGAKSTFTFRGRIGGRKLAPGRYRLAAVVGKTAPKLANFTIVR